MKIAFIGGGNMSSALFGGMLARGGVAAADVLVIEPTAAVRERLHAQHGVAVDAPPVAGQDDTASAGLRAADVVVFAVKPQVFRDVAEQVKGLIGGALVVSVAAGIRIADISRWLDGHTRIVRAMPNTPALIGQGITGVAASDGASAADRERAAAILGAVGQVVWCDGDDRIDAVTGISGSGPAYVFYFIEALQRAAQELGFGEAEARQLALGTFTGAAQLAAQSEESVGTLRERVTSPNGTTAAALATLAEHDVADGIVAAARAAYSRAIELGDALSK
ncbi:pyrroline-5-carboxylate reductase [Chitinasiproducens palmae]|uniref:Pyrroline-5-carboxylate reductase n=1 Tax=Chitinasiproducens palmae TaxID=1770053 RepID=A0A1H2PRD9_9BURK|nr:pyrroline-5-carboxylate reductase [Chitinasiproducens palmae]SDV49478.1 pyrroline-5-carboxylate reductase [Chitinasiproducens palmae]